MLKLKVDLKTRIDDESLKLFVATKKLSHEKIYVLKASDGRTRVITGSANMSLSAFSGKQRENIICFDTHNAFNWYMACFNDLKVQSSDSISKLSMSMNVNGDNLHEIPVMQSAWVSPHKAHSQIVATSKTETFSQPRFESCIPEE